ncbi:MAG TPA: ABC transporter permease, partial [Oscillospiraceae bacterium]|nr:ABC transporter permease [Oscillospiraceae bacterium]
MAKSKRIKEGIGYDIVQVLIYIFVGLFALLTVLPFLYIIAGSFATEKELTERSFFIIPTEFSINAYKYIISTGEIFRGLKNSVYLTVVGTLVQMVFTTTFAYPLSKSDFRGRNFVLNMVIVTMVFGG